LRLVSVLAQKPFQKFWMGGNPRIIARIRKIEVDDELLPHTGK
jgi:hypothetical protein